MPYPSVHYLTAFGGLLPGGEGWSTSLRSTPNFAGSTTVNDVAAAVSAWFVTTTSPVCRAATLTWVKHNAIGLDGKYQSQTTNLVEYATPVLSGGPSSPQHPNQTALVATLETGLARGLAHRGRMFLPLPRYGLQADGRITAADALAAATSVAGLLSALNGVAGFGDVIVASNVREGAVNSVTAVSVGRVLDTVRSRRTSLGEERTALATVTGGS